MRSPSRASHKNSSRSREKASTMPGRNTLTATSRPSVVVAKCTCAMDAAATAVSSKAANIDPRGLENSASISSRAWAPGNGGRRSCRLARSRVISSPKRSARVDSSCPSLMKLGPSSWKAEASRWPGRAAAALRRRANARAIRDNGATRGTLSNGKSASCRASVTTMLISRARLRPRRRNPKRGRKASETPSRMERSDAPCEVAKPDPIETRLSDHSGQLALPGEAPNAFDEVSVSLAIPRYDRPEQRHEPEAVEIVQRLQKRRDFGHELETHEAATGTEYAACLGERCIDLGNVSQPESDRIKIDGAVRGRKPFSVGAHPFDSGQYPLVERAGAAQFEHPLAGVADQHPTGRLLRRSKPLQRAHRDVPRAAGNVEQNLARPRLQPRYHRVLPQPMDAAAHQVVHQVIARRNAVEHGADQAFLFCIRYAALAKVDGAACFLVSHRAGR